MVLSGHEHTRDPDELREVVSHSGTGSGDTSGFIEDGSNRGGSGSSPVVGTLHSSASGGHGSEDGPVGGETGDSDLVHLFEDGSSEGVGVTDTTSESESGLASGNTGSVGVGSSEGNNEGGLASSGGGGRSSSDHGASVLRGNSGGDSSEGRLVGISEKAVSHGDITITSDDEVKHIGGIERVGCEEVS